MGWGTRSGPGPKLTDLVSSMNIDDLTHPSEATTWDRFLGP
jgi:hypothetical protein